MLIQVMYSFRNLITVKFTVCVKTANQKTVKQQIRKYFHILRFLFKVNKVIAVK